MSSDSKPPTIERWELYRREIDLPARLVSMLGNSDRCIEPYHTETDKTRNGRFYRSTPTIPSQYSPTTKIRYNSMENAAKH